MLSPIRKNSTLYSAKRDILREHQNQKYRTFSRILKKYTAASRRSRPLVESGKEKKNDPKIAGNKKTRPPKQYGKTEWSVPLGHRKYTY
jgi:hypothetical protein